MIWFMAFNATFNNISVISKRSALLVEETGRPGENHLSVASHWQTLSHNVVHLALIEIRTHKISGQGTLIFRFLSSNLFILITKKHFHLIYILYGVLWPWSYGSWIYNYLCNQCLLTTDLVSSNLDQGEVYNIMW
jgi:hypothetical protein